MAVRVEVVRLDQGEGDVGVEAHVVRQVDDFAGTLAEQRLEVVAAGDGGVVGRPVPLGVEGERLPVVL